MSTVQVTDFPNRDVTRITWASLAAEETGAKGDLGKCRDNICVQVSGTFNTESVTMEGSLDGSVWATLSKEGLADATAAAEAAIPAVLAAAGIYKIREPVSFIRPVVSAGSGVDLKVTVTGVGYD
jgi:hypothetical protein